MKVLRVLLMLAAFSAAASALAADIRAEMAALDRAYIPVYALTSEHVWDQARKAIRLTFRAWQEFEDNYRDAKTTDAASRADLARVHALFYDANAILEGPQPELALEPLKRIRTVMAGLRQRKGIEYYLDDLVAFSEPMESIAAADAVAKVRAQFPAAKQAWQRVAQTEPGSAFGLGAAQREELGRRRDAQTAALGALEAALAGNDSAAIMATAAAIKPPFDRVYYFFGDFHALMWVESPPAKR